MSQNPQVLGCWSHWRGQGGVQDQSLSPWALKASGLKLSLCCKTRSSFCAENCEEVEGRSSPPAWGSRGEDPWGKGVSPHLVPHKLGQGRKKARGEEFIDKKGLFTWKLDKSSTESRSVSGSSRLMDLLNSK